MDKFDLGCSDFVFKFTTLYRSVLSLFFAEDYYEPIYNARSLGDHFTRINHHQHLYL
jgi:hypothetical protein